MRTESGVKYWIKYSFVLLVSLLLLLIIVQWGLRWYTHHGQKLEMPDFVNTLVTEASIEARNKKFEIIVNDSVFIVGKKGGMIIDQNPEAGSYVKQNRKVYVTITKYETETIRLGDLPVLYGNSFDQKKSELKYRDIDLDIRDYAYDPAEPNHILSVYYNGELVISKDIVKKDVVIKKGTTLECIVSKRDGGDVTIPDLRCMELEEARFILESSKLKLGSVVQKGDVVEGEPQFIINQSPPYDGITNIKMGESVTVTVASEKPASCY
jgi:D-alanine-D-alanine ligase